MFAKIVLVFIVMTADGGQYKDFVGAFDTAEQCESAKKNLKQNISRTFPGDHVAWGACVKPQALSTTSI